MGQGTAHDSGIPPFCNVTEKRVSRRFRAWPSRKNQADLDRPSRTPQKRGFMKAHFSCLNLLLALGLAGCGPQAPEQDTTSGPSAGNGKSSSVVLAPPPKPVAAVTPEPETAVKPASKPVAAATLKPKPAIEPAPKPEPEDTTPKRDIFRSAGSGDIDAVKYHLANGIKVNSQDKTGKTPLLWAVRSQKHAVVSHLLARGANPNLADNSNVTPLFWAVRMRRPELVSQLLSKGADIGHKDKNGRTALDHARDETIIEILRRHASEKE
tara:strand:+ start:287 stop:1087 length:801 start_codon:yes stop_codon:yes gene_type:complete